MTSAVPRTIDSPARHRTRRAILAAGARVLAADRTATMAQIAEAAEVGRSTLHRYFPDRDELVRAVAADSFRVLAEAVQQAAPPSGPPAGAVRRLVAALMDTGDRLRFLAANRQVPAVSPAVRELIERGQVAGVLDPWVGPDWLWRVLWAVVHAGSEEVAAGRMHRHDATSAVLRTLEHGIDGPRILDS